MSAAGEVVGLVPAAGYARRLQPLSCSKEVLTIGGRPLMSFLLARMRIAGCSRIRVTTRPDKTDVVELARREGIEVVLARPESVSDSLLAGLVDLPDDAVALVGFPDTIWEPADGFVRLVEEVRAGEELVLGLFEVEEPERCDVVEMTPAGRVRRITVKPERPATNVTWGILAGRVASLRALSGWDEPGAYFDALARRGTLRGVRLAGPYDDAGTPAGLTRLGADRVYDEGRETGSGMNTSG